MSALFATVCSLNKLQVGGSTIDWFFDNGHMEKGNSDCESFGS